MDKNISAIETLLVKKASDINKVIDGYMPKEEGFQKTIMETMTYNMQAGGKRIRPMLMQETFRMLGGKGPIIEPFMVALEMIHTYSLVHDDLPAMDNDDYRRGRKTTHVIYGEGMAVLAGDALLNYAFETALKSFTICGENNSSEQYQRIGRALSVLSKKAGIYGMIGGQTADLEAENEKSITSEKLLFIHEHKTAALIEAAMMIGAILAGASEERVNAMKQCASNIGIAFQIQDDILDVIGNEVQLGKPVGSDEKNHKQTYVTLVGLDRAEKEVEKLSMQALDILMECPGDSLFLQELTEYLIHRKK